MASITHVRGCTRCRLVSVHAKRLALFYGLRVAVASAELQLLKVLVRRWGRW